MFQDPLPGKDENGNPLPPVDSQRIYSALMRRIGEEEAEMEETRAALEEIHNSQEIDRNDLAIDRGKSTIRAVSRTTKASSIDEEDTDIYNSVDSVMGASLDMAQHKANVERRKQEVALQEEQQSFFPFSDQHKRSTPSPFRKLLDERRSQDLLRSADDGPSLSTPLPSTQHDSSLQRSHACLSSESIYSRTTNGGANEDYTEQIGSEELYSPGEQLGDATGVATIIPQRYKQRPSIDPNVKPSTANSSEHEWKGWIQGQVDSLSSLDTKPITHFREHAQIDPDDVGIATDDSGRPPSRAGPGNQFPILGLKQVSTHNTPVPRRNSSLTKGQSGSVKRASTADFDAAVGKPDETRKVSSGLRKISPGNIARILKERKSQILLNRNEDPRKENKPSPRSESPPVSTPGRLGLQMRSGNGRLRKRASESIFTSKDNGQQTIKKTSTPGRLRALENDESPTDRVKQSLSARLSRPFNMDVPEPNRPFDSMFLGKGELDPTATGRLSVAPNESQRGPGGYGGLGANPFDGERDTALPDIGLRETIPSGSSSKSGLSGLWNSKRMVSDFLRKRRAKDLGDEQSNEGSPAFV
jgi:hypothetical protein